jgi:hypothetical protein
MPQLTADQIKVFHRDGFVCVPGFYDLATEVEPIQRAVYDLISLVIRRHDLPIRQQPYDPKYFDSGFNELIAVQRRYGGEVYDAIKMIPAFVRLAAGEKGEAAILQLRNSSRAGFISHGYGIRIDIPGEDKYRALWHQEYLAQLRSRDGITIWSPLVQMTQELGPVQFAVGSHREGIHRVYEGDSRKPGIYSWTLENESELIARYPHVAPLAGPGDAIILDFQVLHCSGFNRSTRPRWSMQMRLFNFLEPSGVLAGWPGAVAEGVRVPEIYPEFFIPAPSGVPT